MASEPWQIVVITITVLIAAFDLLTLRDTGREAGHRDSEYPVLRAILRAVRFGCYAAVIALAIWTPNGAKEVLQTYCKADAAIEQEIAPADQIADSPPGVRRTQMAGVLRWLCGT